MERSNRVAAAVIGISVAVLLGLNFIRWIVIWIFFPLTLEEQIGSPILKGCATETTAP